MGLSRAVRMAILDTCLLGKTRSGVHCSVLSTNHILLSDFMLGGQSWLLDSEIYETIYNQVQPS